jgi:hypothetical protein
MGIHVDPDLQTMYKSDDCSAMFTVTEVADIVKVIFLDSCRIPCCTKSVVTTDNHIIAVV